MRTLTKIEATGDSVMQPATHRRPTRRTAVVAGLAALASAVAASVLASAGDDRSGEGSPPAEEAVAARADRGPREATVPTVAQATSLAAPPATVPTASAPGTTAPAASPAPATCLNSADPSCGRFVWEPAPRANQPLTISFEVLPAEPRAGELVTVRVVASDPDAPVTTNGGTYSFADPHSTEPQIGFPMTVERAGARYGPWTPPAPQPGRLEMSFTHTFSQPGTFAFTFAALSGEEQDPGNPDRNPYASRATASVPIRVGVS